MDRSAFKAIFVWVRCHLILVTATAFVVVGYILRDELYNATAPVEPTVSYGLEGERGTLPVSSSLPQTLAQTPDRTVDSTEPFENRVLQPEEPPREASASAETAPEPLHTGHQGGSIDSVVPQDYRQPPLSWEGSYHFRPLSAASDSGAASAFRDRQQELLNGARRAFWNDDLDTSLELYRALVKEFPEQPDYLEELGNVHFKKGNKDLAAEAYFEAGVRFGKQGERGRAEKLRELLKDFDPGHAKALEDQLEGVAKPIATR